MSDRTGTTRRPEAYGPPDDSPSSGNHDARAEQWKSQIQAQKSAIASLQREIASLSESVHYAGGNCVANCVQWNERQKEKQDRVEVMKQQLEEQEKTCRNPPGNKALEARSTSRSIPKSMPNASQKVSPDKNHCAEAIFHIPQNYPAMRN